ncbi:hypothetical protein I2W78_35665 [Streptomyces spinoverrucosus]|nr:hypothetical protein [Streptomyces spinoverrucosus]MBG0857047.1 hypothetical protein [Streptomyces spinoverrucosus]
MATPDADFLPTHVAPKDGLAAWETPDASRPTVPLDPLLPVQLIERLGDWGRIMCHNGWSAWVDGRLLVPVPQTPPTAGAPPARTADPRPLLAHLRESLDRYWLAVEDMAAGKADGDAFRQRTRGLRAGLVIDGEAAWLYDVEQERWMYCDGTRIGTYAVSSAPSSDEAPATPPKPAGDKPPTPTPTQPDGGAPAPTKVVNWPDESR